jgi:hypothetical protein
MLEDGFGATMVLNPSRQHTGYASTMIDEPDRNLTRHAFNQIFSELKS